MAKKFEMTGSPKPHFAKKEEFIETMTKFGWIQCKMTKKNNQCEILVSDDLSKSSNKMTLANELGVEIMSYADIVELFDLESQD